MARLIPTSPDEVKDRGWNELDVILVSGDAYVDHHSFGVAVIARVLEAKGYRVAIIDNPDFHDPDSVKLLGRPRLFFGVTGGNIDSVVSRYTSFLTVRNDDPYLPGEGANPRPLRSVISYCNLIKAAYKDVLVVIGGIEASMRRLIHYDYLDNKLRRSILLDSKADLLIYGMGELPIVETAARIEKGLSLSGIAGTVHIEQELPEGDYLSLGTQQEVFASKDSYADYFRITYLEGDRIFVQPEGKRYLVQYPPPVYESGDLDYVYSLPFSGEAPDKYKGRKIKAMEMIADSITSHRGCVSGCAFCSIALHQGRRIISRSRESIMEEVKRMAAKPTFKGHIRDLGGPSANMYGTFCKADWRCKRESCLYPEMCPNLTPQAKLWFSLLDEACKVKGVKHLSIGSGIRYDLLMRDYPEGLEKLVERYVGGQLKIAPEHTSPAVLRRMRKSPVYPLGRFVKNFRDVTKRLGIKRYLIPYLMSNHPGSDDAAMKEMKKTVEELFGMVPDQVQSFFPLPMTLSSVQYYCGFDPLDRDPLFVNRDKGAKRKQHAVFFEKNARRGAQKGNAYRHERGRRSVKKK